MNNKPVILCVDDEKTVLDSLRIELREALEENFDFEIAENGEHALEIIEELILDKIEVPLVISDQIMPGIKGDLLLIKIHEILPDTLKILLTGQANVDAIGNAVNHAQLYRYIAKPWDTTDLILTVNEATKSYFQAKTLEKQNEKLEELVKELQITNESLEDKVTERTAEVIRQKEEIERQNEKLVILHENEKKLMELELTTLKLEGKQAVLEMKIKEEENLRLIAEAEKEKLQNEKLKSDLELRNRELTSSSLHIAKKNEILNQMKTDIQTAMKNVSEKNKVILKSFIKTINSNVHFENDWERLKLHFEQVNEGFFERLNKKHPNLTANDHKFCAYLYLNITTKEIANLLGSSHRTVESSKYRLRKKLELPSENSLEKYMHEI